MRGRIAGMLIMSAFLFAATGAQAQSSTYYVDASRTDDTGNGLTWAAAKQTIQAAVDAASDGDIVLVTNGTYDIGDAVTPGFALTNRVCITKPITVQSANGPEVTIIVGAPGSNGSNDVDAIRGVFMSGGCSLIGFTVTNGYTMASEDPTYDQSGGGIWMTTNCAASNLIVSGNTAYTAGGGAVMRGGGTMNNCTLNDNMVVGNFGMGMGGGAAMNGGGTMNNCTLNDNMVVGSYDMGMGGGAYLSAGVTLNNCSLNGNSAENGAGGGAYLQEGGTMNNCTLSVNTANKAGGAYLHSSGTMNNCSLNGNSAENGAGGGAYLQTGGTLNNCTLSRNSAENGAGGGAYLRQGGTMNNCIVWDNTTDGSGNDIFNYGTGQTIRNTCASDGVIHGTNGCITTNPLFVDGANSNFQLQVSSPGINTGNNTYAPTNATPYDLAGNLRIIGGTVDMGAIEFISDVYVDASMADDSGNGFGWATAKKTIQAGVDMVNAGGTVWVTNGTYDTGGKVTPGKALTNRVCITKPITVQSMNGPEVTIIAGAPGSNGSNDVDAIRGVFMTNGCSLIGFTVTNGYTMASENQTYDQSGGGIWMTTNCAASNLIVNGNSAAYSGGGTLLHEGGTMNNSTLSGNMAQAGGGAAMSGGGTMNNCTLNGNTANTGGGGAFLYEGGTLNNCALSGNSASAGDGGGASFYQGGILNNCTLSRNSAAYSGGGAFLYGGGTLNNCIAWDNTSADSGRDIYRSGGGSAVRNTCASDGVIHGTDGCITNNPLFVDGANSNFQLQASSPGINAGDNTYAPTNATLYDLEGNLRIMYETVDMGAYERQTLPGIRLLGINGAVIADGEAASEAKGTAFGEVIPGSAFTNTFSITNTGSATLDVTVWSINGAGADAFAVHGMPSAVDGGGVSNFSVVFSPTAAGVYTSAVVIANNSTNAEYILNLSGEELKRDQTITFPAIPDQDVEDTVVLNATASSGLPVSFVVMDGPAGISGGNTLSFTGVGTVSVRASQSGNADWNAAPDIIRTFSVTSSMQPPVAPAGVAASAATYLDKVRVTWNTVEGATSYQVWRHTLNNSAVAELLNTVAAVADRGSAPVSSVAATAGRGIPYPRPATATTAESAANSGFSAVGGSASGGKFQASSLSYDDTTVAEGTTYYYWVKAVNAGGTSAFSSVAIGYPGVVGPLVSINGMIGDNVVVPAGTKLEIGVQMMNLPAEYIGHEVDWWVAANAQTGNLWFYLNSDMIFVPFDGNLENIQPAYQGALGNLPRRVIVEDLLLRTGTYTVWFVVDYPMDGILHPIPGRYLMSRVTLVVE